MSTTENQSIETKANSAGDYTPSAASSTEVAAGSGSSDLKPAPDSSKLAGHSIPQAKKSRRGEASVGQEKASRVNAPSGQSLLTGVPFDILLEILQNTGDPRDLLAVTYTCKDLCQKLTDPSSFLIWEKMRKNWNIPDPAAGKYQARVEGVSNPDGSAKTITGVRNFIHSEPAYAAFVFGGGNCEVCGKETDRSYRSFSLRLRLCREESCLQKIQEDTERIEWRFVNKISQEIASTIPVFESNTIFSPQGAIDHWPRSTSSKRGTRKSLVENASAASRTPEEIKIATARNEIWMKFCVDLFQWKRSWLRDQQKLKKANDLVGQSFADNERWDYSTMKTQTSYGAFFHQKFTRREGISEEELIRMRPTLAHQMHTFKRRKEAREKVKLRESNDSDLWKLYQKLMSQPRKFPYLPPYSAFRELPAVMFLRSDDLIEAQVTVSTAVEKKTSPIPTLLKHQIENWVEQAKRDLLKNMGGSNEWNNMIPARRIPHPVQRLDAYWKCKICDKVEPKFEYDECLDFAGACRHQCREEEEKGKKRRRARTTHSWSADNFVKDEQAGKVMKRCLELLGFSPEDGPVDDVRDAIRPKLKETSWRCVSCSPSIFLRFESVIGHSHRHSAPMEIEIVQPEIELSMRPRPNRFGLAKWLLQRSSEAKIEVMKSNFGCQHCINPIGEEEGNEGPPSVEKENATSGDTSAGSSKGKTDPRAVPPAEGSTTKQNDAQKKPKEFTNKFNFNGLRSHLSSKHGIHKPRDEDFSCYERIATLPGEKSFTLSDLADLF